MCPENDFLYEPENIIPDNVPTLPVGTLAEIQAENMDPSVVPTCGRRVVNGNEVAVRGCPYREQCKLAIRDTAGPQFFGIEYIKGKVMGGKTVRGVRDCFYIALNKEIIEENEGSLRIVAREGEKFKVVEVSPATQYKDRIVEIEVPKFVRPGENPDLAMEQLKAITRGEEEERRANRQAELNTGGVANDGLKTRKPKS